MVYNNNQIHCKTETANRTLYNAKFIVYTILADTLNCTIYTVHRILFGIQCKMYTVYNSTYTISLDNIIVNLHSIVDPTIWGSCNRVNYSMH